MVNDIVDAAEAILAALKENSAFPGSLARRFSLVQCAAGLVPCTRAWAAAALSSRDLMS